MSDVCAVEVLQHNQSPTIAGRSSPAALPGKAGQAHRAGQCFVSPSSKIQSVWQLRWRLCSGAVLSFYSSTKWIDNQGHPLLLHAFFGRHDQSVYYASGLLSSSPSASFVLSAAKCKEQAGMCLHVSLSAGIDAPLMRPALVCRFWLLQVLGVPSPSMTAA